MDIFQDQCYEDFLNITDNGEKLSELFHLQNSLSLSVNNLSLEDIFQFDASSDSHNELSPEVKSESNSTSSKEDMWSFFEPQALEEPIVNEEISLSQEECIDPKDLILDNSEMFSIEGNEESFTTQLCNNFDLSLPFDSNIDLRSINYFSDSLGHETIKKVETKNIKNFTNVLKVPHRRNTNINRKQTFNKINSAEVDDLQMGIWKFDSSIDIPDMSKFRTPNNVINVSQLPEYLLNDGSEYEVSRKAGKTIYEPAILRYPRYSNGKGAEGLCPFCSPLQFYKMNDSSYLHHLNLYHGLFSNGTWMPDAKGGQRYIRTKKKQSIVHQKGLICPYKNCTEKFIRIKNTERDKRTDNRFRVYWRHCKERHNKGKKLVNAVEEMDDLN